jgi:large subunit ribosomal protein L16|tara:strand:+ start:877 stop:1287 length:411 start_codon:yes stop_codon:yes gene_type:complete
MPLMPKRVKHRKQQRGSRKGIAQSGNRLSFGEYGLKSMGRGWVRADQIEACRVAVTRHMKRKGKVWIRIFPDKPVSQKPLETRQGKGKGDPEFWVATVRPGTMLFEVAGVSLQVARESLRLAASKLPVSTRFVHRT